MALCICLHLFRVLDSLYNKLAFACTSLIHRSVHKDIKVNELAYKKLVGVAKVAGRHDSVKTRLNEKRKCVVLGTNCGYLL